MRFRGTIFERRGKFGARVESSFDVPWDEAHILEIFGEHEAVEKDEQTLWSAARYKEGANRGNAGLECNYAAVLDADCTDPGSIDLVCAHLDRLGLAYLVYSSWSHARPEKVHTDTGLVGPFDCFRVVIPYSREVSPAEHSSLVAGLVGHEVPADPPHYAREVAGRFVLTKAGSERAARPRGWDPTSTQPARGYYVPSAYSSIDVRTGKPLDVELVLARPTTAAPTTRTLRPYHAPTASAVGAVGRVQRALAKLELWGSSEPGFSGWYRSVCPACQDPSPSLTYRANGDGVDFKCHAGCNRREVLGALGLEGEVFQAPSQLRLLLDEQLVRQLPHEAPIDVEAAGERLAEDLRAALTSREPTVVEYPAGTGKSYRSAQVMAEWARRGERIAYSTQEHVVAHETRMKLPPDVRARSVHIHSPLIQVGDDPVCARADELKERVFEYGLSLMGQVCPRCPLRPTCEAFAAAQQRARDLESASVVFVSHAGIGQVFGVTPDGEVRGADMHLIVDEMPGTFEEVAVWPAQLEALAERPLLPSADASVVKVVQEIARAWLAGEEPGEVRWGIGGRVMGQALTMAVEWGRLALRDGARPAGTEQPLLKAADALLRLAVWRESGGTLTGLETASTTGVTAMLPNACHEALTARRGVLLSATPMMAALPGFRHVRVGVTDGARVRRVMVLRSNRGSGALTETFYDDEAGVRRRRDREPGEEPGIPWAVVDEALLRAAREARYYGGRRALFVTFKAVADALRASPERRVVEGVEIEVAHFGALRGKNDWMEGASRECDVIYCFGAPRQAIMPTILQLGLRGEAADQAWVAYAAGELAQAEGRLRLPRRTKPCTVFVEGDVAPSTWHPENVDEITTRTSHESSSTALLEAALLWHTQAHVAQALGLSQSAVSLWRQPGRPPPSPQHLPVLESLANPDPAQAMGLLARMRPRRRQTHQELFSWLPDGED